MSEIRSLHNLQALEARALNILMEPQLRRHFCRTVLKDQWMQLLEAVHDSSADLLERNHFTDAGVKGNGKNARVK